MKNFSEADYYLNEDGEAIEFDEAEKLLNNKLPVTAVFSNLLIDCNQGINIPKKFYNNFDFKDWHIIKENYSCLSNNENESYWDVWAKLLDEAYYIDQDGDRFILEQDDDLFCRFYLNFN